MEVVELLKELIKRQSVTPNECGIYEIIKAELADFKVIELEKNGVKNLFLYKDFGADFINQNKNIETNKNQSCEAPKSRPLRGAKNRIQGRSSASADFLLEADKRGTPPKSEKAAAFWGHNLIVGGSVVGGVQPFLRKDSSESNGKSGENRADSANRRISHKIAESSIQNDCAEVSLGDFVGFQARNCENRTDSSIEQLSAQNPTKASKRRTRTHLCFAGHIDIVPAGNNWSVNPFGAIIQNGILYGRGAQDMKGGVACFISALKAVREFDGILSVLLTSDEEGDGIFGTKIMLDELKKRDLLPQFAIVAEPTCEKNFGDSIKIGRRGSINGVLKIFGTQGHAAYPHKCVNPAHLIAPILAQIAGVDLDSGDKHFAPSKIVLTDIRAGIEATNVTPSDLKLMFNVRNNPLTDKNAIENYVKSLLKNAGIQRYDLMISQGSFPFITDSQTLLDSLSRAIKKHTNLNPRPNTEGGTSDARYFSAFGVEVVEFGLINDRIHATDECVDLRDIEKLRDIFIDFIENFK
ncbi:succinyl-diaminopimelate desuccinylase [Helicobacter sp. 23-1045]